MMEATFVVVGGGIAGVSCIQALSLTKPDDTLILISESPVVKSVVNFEAITRTLGKFDVVEENINTLCCKNPMLKIVRDSLAHIDSHSHTITTKEDVTIKYKYLCLCIGAKPNIISQGGNSPFVLGLRDTDSVENLIEKMSNSRKVTIVGNGGIATEVVYKLQNIEVDWVVKDQHISATFVDPGAAEFFQSSLNKTSIYKSCCTRMKYKQEEKAGSGAALGPDWYNSVILSGVGTAKKSVNIHYSAEVKNIIYNSEEDNFPLSIELTTNEKLNSDLLISATGVLPKGNTITTDAELILSLDCGIKVDESMSTSLTDVYAAGDVCTPNWQHAKHWFPMKLWTQAHQMGCYAARCMIAKMNNEDIMLDFCFELFSHSTSLFGYPVVLLGLYNGQKLGTEYECLIRMTRGEEFIKFVLQDHRLQGAILIGNTELAETCENLICNQLDLSPFGDDILNPNVDIEDYFD